MGPEEFNREGKGRGWGRKEGRGSGRGEGPGRGLGRGLGFGRGCARAEAPFRRRGVRMTLTRQVIIDALDRSDDYLSAEDLYLLVRQEYPGIGVATVYRTLQLLEELSLVHRIETGEGKARYAMNREETGEKSEKMSKVLLVCDSCGKIIPSPEGAERGEPLFQEIAADAVERFQFRPFRKTLQIHGLCADCSGSGEGDAGDGADADGSGNSGAADDDVAGRGSKSDK